MKKYLILFVAVFFSLTVCEAQIFKKQKDRATERAEERAERKAQNKVDNKVDETVDKAFEAIEGIFKKKKKNKEAEPEERQDAPVALPDMFGGKKSPSELGLPDKYVFKTKMEGTMTTYNKRGKEESQPFNYLFPENESIFAMEVVEQGALTVMDMDRDKMVSVVKQEQAATVMDIQATMETASQYMDENEDSSNSIEEMPTITKTGESKMIAGYTCDKYLLNSPDMEGEIWLTPDIQRYGFMSMGMKLNEKRSKKNKLPEEYMELMENGFVMEAHFTNKEDNTQSKIVITNVETVNREVDLTKLQLMDISAFMGNK